MKKLLGKFVLGILATVLSLSCVSCGKQAGGEKVECGYCGETDYLYNMAGENPVLDCYVCKDCYDAIKGN